MNSNYFDETEESPPSGYNHDDRVPCQYCGRKFASESLQRHANICVKTHKKRPVFKSEKQREVGQSQVPKTTTAKVVAKPKSNWKQKHEEFVRNIRQARGVQQAIKQGRVSFSNILY